MNRDSKTAHTYHERTKHSVASLQASRHHLDWEIRPSPFKVYPDIAAIPLSDDLRPAPVSALAALAQRDISTGGRRIIASRQSLARLLHRCAGITRKKLYPGGQEYSFRAAACTGALYHIDLYVVCGDLPGLAAGVYHFGPHSFALYQLRAGDHRGVLVGATGDEPCVQHAPVILACASTYWRNSWKYQSRAYRHCFWDSGTVLANLFAVAATEKLPARLVCGFVDQTVDALLGLDRQREGTLALVALGHDPSATAPRPAVPAVSLRTAPLSAREVDYPAIREMHAASSLQSPEEVRAWRAAGRRAGAPSLPAPTGRTFPLRALDAAALPDESIDDVILRRGSTRRFARAAIPFAELSTVLQAATQTVSADFDASPNVAYLIVNAVDGLPAGSYVHHPDANALELLSAGNFRRAAGHLALGQELAAEASVNIYLLCDLEPLLARLGNRAYRVAQLDAAITGGRIYLGAYALRRGATGLTFFDDEVTDFFSPHAAGKSVMFLVAAGRGRRQ